MLVSQSFGALLAASCAFGAVFREGRHALDLGWTRPPHGPLLIMLTQTRSGSLILSSSTSMSVQALGKRS